MKMTNIKNLSIVGLCLILSFSLWLSPHVFAQSGTVTVNGIVLPQDVTGLSAVDVAPGTGDVILTWTTSLTPNVDTQRVEIIGPQGPGINFTTKVLIPFPGIVIADNYANYAPFTNITGLTVGETYIFRLVSIANTFESLGAPPDAQILFTPAPANPAPILLAEPVITQGTENTLYWTNGGINDPTLECRVTASFVDLNLDPLGIIEEDSGWIPCPTSAVTYDYTFTSLSINQIYYYHVQSRAGGIGLSPYSNVESSTQDTGGGRGGAGGGAVCGNGTIESGEQCDDGNRTPGDGCNEFCAIEELVSDVSPMAQACGNAILEAPEECDDGNLLDGDGCSNICEFEIPDFCGDGVVQAPEECDDGNNSSGDGCNPICEIEHAAAPVCGDNFREDPEECDDGNLTDGDGCSAVCVLEAAPVCGNGLVELPETCDDGNLVDDDGCSAICEIELEPVCGNAILEDPEECDDGNLVNFDGCNDVCEEEEIVEVFLHITGTPEYRVTNYTNLKREESASSVSRLSAASDLSTTDEKLSITTSDSKENLSFFDFGATDAFRIKDTPNLGLLSELLLYKPSAGSLDSVNTTLDNFGEGWVAVKVITGTYNFALNGESHNNRVLPNIVINTASDGEIIELDFTKAKTQGLVAGDTWDDNYINAFDIATMLGSYKATGANKNDLNKDESPIVNAIDIAILIWNYKRTGEVL